MRVFIQNRFPEGLMIPGEETKRWVPTEVGDGGEYDQFLQTMQSRTWDPPIPTVADPLCYTLKLRQKEGAGLTVFAIGSYYGDESTYDTAHEYVAFKYETWPSLPVGSCAVIACDDHLHPATDFEEVFNGQLAQFWTLEGYWLASDPDTFVSVA